MDKFIYSNTNKRYHTLDYFYKQKFGEKVCKISLNAGFTCPNIDGTLSKNGCIYCSKSGSGEFGGNPKEELITSIWTTKKIDVLNGIDKEMVKRNTYQGSKCNIN